MPQCQGRVKGLLGHLRVPPPIWLCSIRGVQIPFKAIKVDVDHCMTIGPQSAHKCVMYIAEQQGVFKGAAGG